MSLSIYAKAQTKKEVYDSISEQLKEIVKEQPEHKKESTLILETACKTVRKFT